MHFERVTILLKGEIPLHSDDLTVMFPLGLVTVADPFELSLRSEAALVQATVSSYPLPVLLLGSSYGYLICV